MSSSHSRNRASAKAAGRLHVGGHPWWHGRDDRDARARDRRGGVAHVPAVLADRDAGERADQEGVAAGDQEAGGARGRPGRTTALKGLVQPFGRGQTVGGGSTFDPPGGHKAPNPGWGSVHEVRQCFEEPGRPLPRSCSGGSLRLRRRRCRRGRALASARGRGSSRRPRRRGRARRAARPPPGAAALHVEAEVGRAALGRADPVELQPRAGRSGSER